MTICVALSVPDGIAFAADSQTTWQRSIGKVKTTGGELVDLAEPIQVPIGWSEMARKLFTLKLGGQVYGICTAGAASVNRKTIHSILKSAERTYEGEPEYNAVWSHLQEALWAEFKAQHGTDDLASAPITAVELILGGFVDGDVSKPLLETRYVFSGSPKIDGETNTNGFAPGWRNTAHSDFGCCWIGRKEFVDHVVNHKSKALPPIQGQYEMMTLEDAQSYAQFLVEYTCDFQRFAVMVPDCGRPVVVGKLVPGAYEQKIV